MFLRKGVLKRCSRFIGENPCRSVISIKLLSETSAYFQNTFPDFYKKRFHLIYFSGNSFQIHCMYDQGRYIRRTTIFIFSFCVGLVTQLNGSALGVLKHHHITKRIRELLISYSRFLIYNSLNQLRYYTI